MVDSIKYVHLLISGRVQGVYYRNWTRENAVRRGIKGWVRNRQDGTVEAVLCGDDTGILAMIDDCWQGPKAARVDSIQVSDWQPLEATGFKKLPTE